jgi:hypothetical protein
MTTTKRNTKMAALKELVSKDRDLMMALQEVLEGEMSEFLRASPIARLAHRLAALFLGGERCKPLF